MNYAYIRVSTNYQTVQNQKLAIREYAKYHRIRNIKWVAETISGTKNPEKRKLGNLLEMVSDGDVIVITELSRLGRSIRKVLSLGIIFSRKCWLLLLGFRLSWRGRF